MGYYQILMALEELEKIGFMANDKILCYTQMPFRLKNAQVEF